MIRLFLVDDHATMRASLRASLGSQPDLLIVGEASNGRDFLAQLPHVATDVVLLDVHMPLMGGLETARLLQRQHPRIRTLVLSMTDTPATIYQLLDAGVAGYILKNASLDELVHGIRTVAAGRPFLCSESGLRALHQMRQHEELLEPAQSTWPNSLSKREVEVLQLIGQGLTTTQIADKLFVSTRTIESHRKNILEKTRMKNTASLVRFAISEGLIS